MSDKDKKIGKREKATLARRNLLMEAAITCFAEQGIARTGMRDIASKAGVSIGNLYNHFPGRDDLIAEIARMEAKDLTKVVDGVTTFVGEQGAVKAFVEAYFNYAANTISAILTIEITSEALRNPSIEVLFRGNREMLVTCLMDAMTKDDLEARRECAELVIDTIEGVALRVGLGGKSSGKFQLEALQLFIEHALKRGGT